MSEHLVGKSSPAGKTEGWGIVGAQSRALSWLGEAEKTSWRSWYPSQVLKRDLIRADGEGRDRRTCVWAAWSQAQHDALKAWNRAQGRPSRKWREGSHKVLCVSV